MKNIKFDSESGVFVKREEITIDNAEGIEEIKVALKTELAGIIRQVKGLKRRALEIKALLDTLPAPEVKESSQQK